MDVVSVIIPVYNREKVILNCIESLINQTYKDIEIIVIDDGSVDNTLKKIKEIKDSRLKIYNKKNGGVSSARNFGLTKATGKYVVFVDSDDFCLNNMIEVLVENIKNHDIVFCGYNDYCNGKKVHTCELINASQTDKIAESILYLDEKGALGQPWNKIYKKSIIDKYKIKFDENLSYGEDLKFNLDYLKNVSKLRIISDCLYRCNISSNGLARSYRDNKFELCICNINYYYSIIKKMDDNIDDSIFSKKYYNCFKTGVNNLVLPNCKLSLVEKRNFIISMINTDEIKKNIVYIKKYNLFYYYLMKLKKSYFLYFIHFLNYKIKGRK